MRAGGWSAWSHQAGAWGGVPRQGRRQFPPDGPLERVEVQRALEAPGGWKRGKHASSGRPAASGGGDRTPRSGAPRCARADGAVGGTRRADGAPTSGCVGGPLHRRRHAIDATYRCLPKKHMPMLFHSWAELGVCTAATRYLTRATSMSWWSWMIEPAAKIVFGLRLAGRGREPGGVAFRAAQGVLLRPAAQGALQRQ